MDKILRDKRVTYRKLYFCLIYFLPKNSDCNNDANKVFRLFKASSVRDIIRLSDIMIIMYIGQKYIYISGLYIWQVPIWYVCSNQLYLWQ